jgi:hypothetical protein
MPIFVARREINAPKQIKRVKNVDMFNTPFGNLTDG